MSMPPKPPPPLPPTTRWDGMYICSRCHTTTTFYVVIGSEADLHPENLKRHCRNCGMEFDEDCRG